MGKSMYDFGKQVKEKARQQKQMDKASKRRIAKQSKANIKPSTPDKDSDTAESSRVADIAKENRAEKYMHDLLTVLQDSNDWVEIMTKIDRDYRSVDDAVKGKSK